MGLKKHLTHNATTVQASAEVLADGSGDAVRLWAMVNGITFTLDVTATEEDAQDLLDVYVQTKLDGTNWTDVVHFTQLLGTGGAKRFIEKIAPAAAEAGFEDVELGEGAVRNLFGELWRVVTTIVNDTAPSFTFSVKATPM